MSAPGAISAGQMVSPGQQAINKKLTDDYTDPTTNEGNLLSLITLKNILGKADGDGEIDKTLRAMAREETRHLMLAMKVLTKNSDPASVKLQEKYGRDMSAAIALSKVFKSKSDEKEVEMLLNPFVMDTIRLKGTERNKRGGFRNGAEIDAGGADSDPSGTKAKSAVGGNPITFWGDAGAG